jgi:hypothetical protein
MPLAGENGTASVLTVGLPYDSVPLMASSNGTPTSGTTETFDAVLGYLQCSLVLGHWYRAALDDAIGNGSVAADVFTVQIRNSQSASNPTSSSTLVAQTEFYASAIGTAGRTGLVLGAPFECTVAGSNTFGVSATRQSGTGVFTPVGSRWLYVVDLGGN